MECVALISLDAVLLAHLASALVKGVVLLAIAGLVALVLRRCSAATRHLMWTSALIGLLILPLLSLVAPTWRGF